MPTTTVRPSASVWGKGAATYKVSPRRAVLRYSNEGTQVVDATHDTSSWSMIPIFIDPRVSIQRRQSETIQYAAHLGLWALSGELLYMPRLLQIPSTPVALSLGLGFDSIFNFVAARPGRSGSIRTGISVHPAFGDFRMALGVGGSFGTERSFIEGARQSLFTLRPEARLDSFVMFEMRLGGVDFGWGLKPYWTVWNRDVSAWRCSCDAVELASYEADWGAAIVVSVGVDG
jgi:hypothetical protein